MGKREAWVWAVAVFGLQVGFIADLIEPGRGFRLLLVSLMSWLVVVRLRRLGRGTSLPALAAACVALLAGLVLLGAALAPAAERCSVLVDGWRQVALWLLLLGGAAAVGREADQRFDHAIALGCAAALVPAGVWGLAQAWFGWAGPGPLVAPPAGPWFNRNVAAQALVILVPLALAAGLNRRHRWWFLASGGVGLMLLVATRSRGGWVAALAGWGLAGAVVILGRLRREGLVTGLRPWLVPGVVLASCVVVAALVPVAGDHPLPPVGRVVEMTLEPVAGGTVDTRRALWANTAAMVGQHPWTGVGVGRWKVVYPLFQKRVVATPGFGLRRQPHHAHNEVLEFAAEYGLPALGLLLALLLPAFWRLARRAWAGQADAGLRLAALGGVMVHAQVSFPLHAPATAALFWLVVGSALRPEGRPGAEGVWRGAGWKRALVVLLGMLAVVGSVVAWRDLGARRHLARAVAAVEDRRCGQALDEARRAWESSCHRDHRGRSAVVIWTCEKDPESSLEYLEPALAAYPHRLELLLDTGSRWIKAGHLDRAERAYRHALEIEPNLGRGWLGLAMTLERAGRVGSAREACTRALSVEPSTVTRTYCAGLGVRQ